jgi:EmrB/QacA subfamily drug resistance transporter
MLNPTQHDMVKQERNPWIVLLVLCAGFFMILLDTTVVNIAIPSIIDSLHASLDQILWVLNGYILVYAVLLITAGRFGDLYGQRNMFALGLVIFTAASAYCGLAPDIAHLQVARVIQGLGGALLTPQTLAILTTIFPPDRRGAAFGVWGGVAGVATVAGPTLGGYLVTNWSWRAIFYINLPIGIMALVATFLVIPNIRPGRNHGLDWVGVALATAGLFAIVFALVEGQRFNWGGIWGPISIPLLLALGIAILAGFVFWESKHREPLMPLSLFSNRNFALMNWVAVAVAFGMLGLFLPIVIYLQSVLGLNALEAGLTIAPMSLVSIFVAPVAGRLADKIGGKYILFAGSLLFGAGMGSILFVVDVNSTPWSLVPSFVVAGFGMGMVFSPMATVAMRNVSPAMAGAASGVFNSFRQLGAVIGSSVVGAILQAGLAQGLMARAAAAAGQVPPEFRQRFLDSVKQASQGGLEVGPGQNGGSQLPPGIPTAVAQQLQQIFHSVFAGAFLDAMRPAIGVPVAVLLLGALSTLFIQRRKRSAAQQPQEPDASEELALAG